MPAGRPAKITPEVVKKLTLAFANGLTDQEACLFAGVSKQALYDYCKKHPEFTDHKETLKRQPGMKAKFNLTASIEAGDLDNSKWWLERKCRDEFSTKQSSEISGPDGGAIQTENRIVIDFGDDSK